MKIIVKMGGATVEDGTLLRQVTLALTQLAWEHQVAVVHGGGSVLTRMLAKMGKASDFVNGLRITDVETRDLAVMVLTGYVNKKVVAAFAAFGQPAMGLCGADGLAFRARKKAANGQDLGFVGEISAVNPSWFRVIWEQHSIPVISSIALGEDGEYYNVNADQAASACAVACQAELLIFFTDVPGVRDDRGLVVQQLSLGQAAEMAQRSVIRAGMLPKLEACRTALLGGVSRVRLLPVNEMRTGHQLDLENVCLGTEILNT